VRVAAFVVLTLVGQRLLGLPGAPPWLTDLWLPIVWLVWPPMREDRPWPFWAMVLLGLGWDVVTGPVIGPGGIAWSGAGLAIAWLARRVGDRSPVTWAAAGGAAAGAVMLLDRLARLPLGLAGPWRGLPALRVLLLAVLWCGIVGTVQRFDVAAAVRRVRRRRLR